jgi:glucokinase
MILAGDIGGTKTLLALVDGAAGVKQPVHEARFASKDYGSLDEIIDKFLAGSDHKPAAASFGIAGRVSGRQCRTTNLTWLVDADAIGRNFGIPRVHLLNDVQAVATAVPHLEADELHVLNDGRKEPQGVIGVIAPGTGLGEAFLTWSGSRYRAWPSEGGHASFAPVTQEQLDLLEHLERRFGHVSFERVCSGSGFPNIYDYLVATGRYEEPHWLREGIKAAKDPTPLIMDSGYERKAPICIAALDLFVRILGGVVGNMALKVMATGGLYLGGGLPPRIIPRLEKRDFLEALFYKGRFREWLSKVPVFVILDPKAALHGAAWDALEAAGD